MKRSFCGQDVIDAYARIADYVAETPLVHSMYLSNAQQNVYLKMESLQSTKSFKIRGCLNKMLSLNDEEKAKGVITVSSGNHGISVAYGAKLLGIREAVIIVPKTTPQSKVDKIRYFGGQVMMMGQNYDEAHVQGMQYVKSHDYTFIDSYYDDPFIYAGQGTIALEILKQNPQIDTILVPVGGGGMLTGIAVAAHQIDPKVQVIGVQTAACPALVKSYQEHRFYEECESAPSICDALIGGIGKLCYEMAKDYIADLLTGDEETIRKAVAHIINYEKFVVEPGGAVGVAALFEKREHIKGRNIAIVLSGGNINETLMLEILNEQAKQRR